MDIYYHERVEHHDQIPAKIIYLNSESIHQFLSHDIFIPTHWHRSLEISYIENAEVILQIQDKEYCISNDFTCINSGIVHSLRAKTIDDNANCMIVLFSYDFIKQYYPQIDDIVFDLNLKKDHSELKQLYDELKHLYFHQDSYTYIDINACLLRILALLLREFKVLKGPIKIKRNQDIIKDVLTYLHDHYQEDLTLYQLADLFHMSHEYLSRQFHHYVGKTFRDYLSSYRLYKAYDDVVNSYMTIQDIALKHGFLNVKSLIKIFRETYGMTPLQYRKMSNK